MDWVATLPEEPVFGFVMCVRALASASFQNPPFFLLQLLRLSKLIRHRGPDGTGVYVNQHHGVYMCHERLTIVDTTDRGK